MTNSILTSNAFLAHHARRLAELIISQGTELLEEQALTTPTTSVSTILQIHQAESITITQLAAKLNFTHQMVTLRIASLEKLGLVSRVTEETEKRKKIIRLSSKGQHEAKKLELICEQMADVFDQLNQEVGCNLTDAIIHAEQKLLALPMRKRI